MSPSPFIVAFAGSAAALAPATLPVGSSRCAVRTNGPTMSAEPSRRELFGRVGAAVVGLAPLAANAKAGQFSKQGFFGMSDLSSPYQPGGPKIGEEATFGYQKTGEWLAKDYEGDVERERASFKTSAAIVKDLQSSIDSKTWWYVRTQFRTQAYTMKQSMLAINKALGGEKSEAAGKAYKKFWKSVEVLDQAVVKKELALSQKAYADVLANLDAYTGLI